MKKKFWSLYAIVTAVSMLAVLAVTPIKDGAFRGTGHVESGQTFQLDPGSIFKPQSTVTIAASAINWQVGKTFAKTLSANTTFTFSNVNDGDWIHVYVTNTASNYTVTWPTVVWVAGVPPVQTVGAKTDEYIFRKVGSAIFGRFVQNYSAVSATPTATATITATATATSTPTATATATSTPTATATATSTATATATATPGLLVWLKADALALSDNDPVASWTDSSGNGNHAVQATSGNRPVFKTAIINSLPAVRFDGSNDYLSIPSLTKGGFTIFYVFKTTAGGLIGEHGVNAGTNEGDYFYSPGSSHFVASDSSANRSSYNITTPSLADGTWRIVSRVMDGTDAGHNGYVNGVIGTRGTIAAAGNPGTAPITADYYIGARAGASLFMAGDIAEILIYDTAMNTGDREAKEDVLSAKYSISVTH